VVVHEFPDGLLKPTRIFPEVVRLLFNASVNYLEQVTFWTHLGCR
jgi:hypothetical protein